MSAIPHEEYLGNKNHVSSAEIAQALGRTSVGLTESTDPALASTEKVFSELSTEEFCSDFVKSANDRGLELTQLMPPRRKSFVLFAHTMIHNYHAEKFNYEWRQETEQGVPPPLPGKPMRQRIERYFGNPEIQQWATDAVQAKKLDNIYDYYEPYAKQFRYKIPEIGEAYDLRKSLQDLGYDNAQRYLGDLIAIYGQAVVNLIRSAEQRRQEQAGARTTVAPRHK